ncbi:MAG: hypothetical protein V4549_07670 [Bacteroidota bacterium]
MKKNAQPKIVEIPAEELDMFTKCGVKQIIKGSTTIKLIKSKKQNSVPAKKVKTVKKKTNAKKTT